MIDVIIVHVKPSQGHLSRAHDAHLRSQEEIEKSRNQKLNRSIRWQHQFLYKRNQIGNRPQWCSTEMSGDEFSIWYIELTAH